MVAWGLWYMNPNAGWALAVALAPLVLRLVTGRRPLPRTPLDLPLIVFLLTAGLGVWAAYDRAGAEAIYPAASPVGWRALWGIVLSVLVYYAFAAMETDVQQRWTMALLAGFGAGIAFWFTAATDWSSNPSEVATLTHLGQAYQAWLPRLSDPGLHPNATARMVLMCLPASVGLVAEAFGSERKGRWRWAAWGAVTGAMIAFSLLLSTSRGAWLGLAVGLSLMALWWLAGKLWPERQWIVFVGLIASAALCGIALVVLFPSFRVAFLRVWSMAGRQSLSYEGALLLRDYPFTGIGLNEFPLVHSTYALMIHVPVVQHAHFTLLDMALSQGVLGVLAAMSIFGGAAWLGLRALARTKTPPPILVAGLLALVMVSVHDLVDDPLYSTLGLPLIWIPVGAIIAGWRTVEAEWPREKLQRKWSWYALAVVTVIGLVLLIPLWQLLGAAWFANLGALHQTRTELSQYDYEHFDDPTLDEIRKQADLSVAEGFFARALALEPGQVTARTRLAQIALGRGQYERALAHVQAAWDAGHRDRVTRLLLGEALVATGQVEAGVQVVRGLEWAQSRFEGQAWYRYWVNEDYLRAANAWRANLILDPESEYTQRWLAEAEARANNP
jgi:O-antigen ligase